MPPSSRKRRKRKRSRQASGKAAARPKAMERGSSRGRKKDDEARAKLKPLAPGDRPAAVTVGAIVAGVLGLTNLGLYLAGVEINGERPGPLGIALYSAVLLLTAWGMWRARYWAVLGMQALLAIVILFFALLIVGLSKVGYILIALAVIIAAGTLFWFLIKAMARIQMPERPGASR